MAQKNFTKKKIQETKGGQFGKYAEGNGGGTPIGGIYGGGHGRGIWKKAGSPGHRDSQPRTADGKFTYNSVNGKTISTEESRGKTVNPLLTGGKNGVKISDVEQEFSQEKGAYWDKYKDKWYRKGGEIVLGDAKVRVAAEAIWEVAKRKYDDIKGEFKEESEVFGGKAKSGAKTKEEKAAIQKAKQTGEEQAVIDVATGGIKIKPGIALPKATPTQQTQQTQKPYQKVTTTASPVAPTAKLTHSPEELKQGRDALIAGGFDVTNLTDEQLDQKWDEFFE